MKSIKSGLAALPWVRHGFFTRIGGVSEGEYATLNCGLETADDADKVAENRGRVADELRIPRENLITLKQVHSAKVVTVTEPFTVADRPEADALVTNVPNIGLAVLSADCVPILISARDQLVVAAIHAGWKGALAGVIEATVARLGELEVKPADIAAVIGPCIRQESYEVAGDFPAPFIEQDPLNEKFFKPSEKAGHLMFDLPGYVVSRLKKAGVGHIDDLARNTMTDTRQYFSHRRSTLAGEAGGGRMISVIAIDPEFKMPPPEEKPADATPPTASPQS